MFIKDSDLYWLISNILLVLWYIHKNIEISNDKYRVVAIIFFNYDGLFDDLEQFANLTISNDNRIKLLKTISSTSNCDILDIENYTYKVIQYIFDLFKEFLDKY